MNIIRSEFRQWHIASAMHKIMHEHEHEHDEQCSLLFIIIILLLINTTSEWGTPVTEKLTLQNSIPCSMFHLQIYSIFQRQNIAEYSACCPCLTPSLIFPPTIKVKMSHLHILLHLSWVTHGDPCDPQLDARRPWKRTEGHI